jgi:nicotinamidase-related amidase
MKYDSLPAGSKELDREIDPKRLAVLGIHWQRGLVDADSPFGSVFAGAVAEAGVLDTVGEIFAAARTAGSLVVHVNICNPPVIIANTPVYKHAQETGALKCGSPEVHEVEELSHPNDVSLEHHRASSFAGTALAQILAARGIDTVALTGIATNVAVEGTAREAADRGLKTFVVADCCIAAAPDRHDASIENMKVLTTGVIGSAELLRALRG